MNLGICAPCPRGDWNSTTAYNKLNIVRYQGATYMANQDVPQGILPTNTTYWLPISDNFIDLEAQYLIGKTFRYVGTVVWGGTLSGTNYYAQGWIDYTRTGVYVRNGVLYGRGTLSFYARRPSNPTSSQNIIELPTAAFLPTIGEGNAHQFHFVIPNGAGYYNSGMWMPIDNTPSVDIMGRGNSCRVVSDSGNIYIKCGIYSSDDDGNTNFALYSQQSVFSNSTTAIFGNNISMEETI